MRALHAAFPFVLIIGVGVDTTARPETVQTPPPKEKEEQAPAPGLHNLSAADRRADELDKAIEAAVKADRWDEAIARAEELLALRTRAQGPNHPEAVDAEWRLRELRRLDTKEDRDAYRSAGTLQEKAVALIAQGKYAEAQPVLEKVLESHRRLLTDEHPQTATSYGWLAHSLRSQGKHAEAQAMYEKVLAIRRRLLTDDHPDTVKTYGNLGESLNRQGKYAAALPQFEKVLAIRRRLLTDDHPDTASAYMSVAETLNLQERYAEALPPGEKALEIRRRLLTDDHPDTASSYNNVAVSLNEQGKHAEAQPLFARALEIRRRRLGDEHLFTVYSYNNLAYNLRSQGKYAAAQPLYEKALAINRRRLGDDHPDTAMMYNDVACNLDDQGKYEEARPLHERALASYRGRLGDDHTYTSMSYANLALNLAAQGKYDEARDRWLDAVKSHDAARLRTAFTGLDRGGTTFTGRLWLAALQARLGQPAEAWRALEEDLGRGLLDELAARQDRDDRPLSPAERARLRELTAALDRLDRLMESAPEGLDQGPRAKLYGDLKRRRELASIALGEFQAGLVRDHGPLAGRVAGLDEIRAALPAESALLAWVDLKPAGPTNAADPDGEHWGMVVRSRGLPAWIPITGTGPGGLWTEGDTGLANRVRTQMKTRPGAESEDSRRLIEKLRTQRLEPLARSLGATADGLPAARRLIVLPSRAMAGVPVEALLTPDDTRTVSYAPSATVFKYLREQPRPDRRAGLLALGDPVFEPLDRSSQPEPQPDHGLLVDTVAPGSNAATHGLKPGDVLLTYHGSVLNKPDDLKVVAEGDGPIGVDVWRDGRPARLELAAGELGVVLDPRPLAAAIAARREGQHVLVAARSPGEGFAPLPGTRYEVEAIARLFKTADRPARILLGVDAGEPELDRLATSGELGRFGFIHLATHGVIDEDVPRRSAVILTQTALPDPLEQALSQKPVFDGRLTVREIQHGWGLKAELVTLSACETALGRGAGGEAFVGFTQALLISGARSVCLSLWRVDDAATTLLMQRFYANLLGRRPGLGGPFPKAEALREAKAWLRTLRRSEALTATAELSGGVERGKGSRGRRPAALAPIPAGADDDRPFASPHFWAAFVLAGDPD